jgi:ribonuclease HI
MRSTRPDYLLFTDHKCGDSADSADSHRVDASLSGGEWRFFLESLAEEDCVEVVEFEPEVTGERLELLAVVRGLEALDQPSRVTLVTPSRYVSRGIRFGIDNWRAGRWLWERHGRMVPVKNADLWQRVDRAMQIHKVNCRRWRIDEPHKNTDDQAQAVESNESTRPIHAARQIVRAVRNGLVAAMKASERARDFGTPNWSLAH